MEQSTSIKKSIETEASLYKLPKYYHYAFLRNLDPEIRFFESLFKKHVPFKVQNLLEPACGTGVYLVEFPDYGYSITGYDLSQEMVDFSNYLIKEKGVESKAKAVQGNMIDFTTDEKFDSAFICLNSLGYLRKDEEIISHFKHTSQILKKGAIYIIDMSFMCNDVAHEKKDDETWYSKYDNVDIEATWQIYKYSIPERIRHVKLTMKIKDGDKKIEFEELHDLRLWLYEEFVGLAKKGGFELVDIYDEHFNRVEKREGICGEDSFLYMVLQNK
jgi:SAM-dependent methyltransferase